MNLIKLSLCVAKIFYCCSEKQILSLIGEA